MEETGQQFTHSHRPQSQPSFNHDAQKPAEKQTRSQFPETFKTDRFLRINQVLEIIPVSRSTWWQKVKEGHYPRGVKLSERTTAWRESEITALIDRLSAESEARVQGAT